MITEKKTNPARRERLHPDWPLKVQTYRCWPLCSAGHVKREDDCEACRSVIPQDLWDTAHAMRRLWNDFAAIFKRVIEADLKDEDGKPKLSKEERKAVWAPLDTKALREVAKGYSDKLDSYCREAVVVDFTRTVGNWRSNPARYGAPRFQRASDMNSIRIPLNFNAGISAAGITGSAAVVGVSYTQPFKYEAPELYLKNGHFLVGINRARLDLHVAYGGRSGKQKYFLPDDCRIKQVSLCGRKDSAFKWSWSLQFRLEHPPAPPRVQTGRVCGWDSGGWRLMGDHIRVGVIADNAGHFYEIMVPLAPATLSRRQRREKAHCEKNGWEYDKPETWADLAALDSRYGAQLEACKKELRAIHEREKEAWPDGARKIMSGIVRMRDTGLRALRSALNKAKTESAAIELINKWEEQSQRLNETIRAFEIHAGNAKRDAYRQIIAWMEEFDRIVWEEDLSLKQMAEEGGRKKSKRKQAKAETGQWPERTPEERQLEASQKFRQIAGQYELRQFAVEKFAVCECDHHAAQHARQKGPCHCGCEAYRAARLIDGGTAYSTQTCPEEDCGAHIEPGRKLLLVCENGHVRDQDCSTAVYFLKRSGEHASISAPPLVIPEHLRGYLRVMAASEVRLELAGAQWFGDGRAKTLGTSGYRRRSGPKPRWFGDGRAKTLGTRKRRRDA